MSSGALERAAGAIRACRELELELGPRGLALELAARGRQTFAELKAALDLEAPACERCHELGELVACPCGLPQCFRRVCSRCWRDLVSSAALALGVGDRILGGFGPDSTPGGRGRSSAVVTPPESS